MNFEPLVDSATQIALDTAWLREELEPVSAYGARAFTAMHPYVPGEERQAADAAKRIAALAAQCDRAHLDAMRSTLASTPEISDATARASMGATLEDADFLEVLRFLDAYRRAQEQSSANDGWTLSPSASVDALLVVLEPGRSGCHGFFLADGYDARLTLARARATESSDRFDAERARIARRIAADLHREHLEDDEFVVMREDLPDGLPQGVRAIREAAAYVLCAIDLDEAALAARTARDGAQGVLCEVEDAARASISRAMRDQTPGLRTAMHAFGAFDMLLAAVRFCAIHRCVAAEIAQEPALAFTGGRFLPVAQTVEAQGGTYKPISLDVRAAAVLTGPNMGGKSVALRTCACIALLAAFGLPVPAASARVALFSSIAWLGIGTESERATLLSSFAQEVVRLRELLERGSTPALMVVDEFARTTTPQEGTALLVALIGELKARDHIALFATHLPGIARLAGVRHFAVRGLRDVPRTPLRGDVNEALRALGDSMDYSIVEVTNTRSVQGDAIALAELLGLDGHIIASARKALHAPVEDR